MLVPPDWCFKLAQRKHRAGHYTYDFDIKRLKREAGPPPA
jgi:hypothetical protein